MVHDDTVTVFIWSPSGPTTGIFLPYGGIRYSIPGLPKLLKSLILRFTRRQGREVLAAQKPLRVKAYSGFCISVYPPIQPAQLRTFLEPHSRPVLPTGQTRPLHSIF